MQRLSRSWLLDALDVARRALGIEPDAQQEMVVKSQAKRLLLNCTRQWGKSTTAALKAAHRAVFQPQSLVVLVSPTERQTGELFGKVSLTLECMGFRRRGDGRHSQSFVLPNGSRVLGVPGTQATVRGYSGASMVIVDEAAHVEDDMYRSLRPMLAVSNGDLILLSTPFGERGFFWREWVDGGAAWERMSVKATDCPRISREFLDGEWKSMGMDWFRQEYLCAFIGMANQAFRKEWMERAREEGLNTRKLAIPGWRFNQ